MSNYHRFTRDRKRSSKVKKSTLDRHRDRDESVMEMKNRLQMESYNYPYKIDMITRDGYEVPLPTYTRSYSFSSNVMCSDMSLYDEELVLLTEGMIQT